MNFDTILSEFETSYHEVLEQTGLPDSYIHRFMYVSGVISHVENDNELEAIGKGLLLGHLYSLRTQIRLDMVKTLD